MESLYQYCTPYSSAVMTYSKNVTSLMISHKAIEYSKNVASLMISHKAVEWATKPVKVRPSIHNGKQCLPFTDSCLHHKCKSCVTSVDFDHCELVEH